MSDSFIIGDISYQGRLSANYSRLQQTENLVYHYSKSYSSEVPTFDFDDPLVIINNDDNNINGLGYVANVLVKASYSSREKKLFVAFASKDGNIDAAVERVETWFREAEGADDDSVDVRFWSLGGGGPRSWFRSIVVPNWEEIKHNYSGEVQEELGKVVGGHIDNSNGKLVLWYGPPGTGKSFAIRAMMAEWKGNVDFDYVVDPEKFFGSHPDYMMDVILSNSHDDDKGKLIILEDTGELLAGDAKQRSGQGLSRLLNVADGLIGQGVDATILITTNEELSSFHPAVVRPGRCSSKVKVGAFTQREANKWLAKQGADITVREEKTLAELYALVSTNGTLRDRDKERTVSIGQYM